MMDKVTQILHCVLEAQMAAENLADVLEGISGEKIDENEQEFKELVVGAHGVPGSELRNKVLKLSQGARTVLPSQYPSKLPSSSPPLRGVLSPT